MSNQDARQGIVTSAEAASGAEAGNTLLPMLIIGLVLTAFGAIVVMNFV